jgi:hypothetical protein
MMYWGPFIFVWREKRIESPVGSPRPHFFTLTGRSSVSLAPLESRLRLPLQNTNSSARDRAQEKYTNPVGGHGYEEPDAAPAS